MASNSDVAHAWAHNLGKNHYGSNMHHDNGRLYSYSTCIGQRFTLGEKIIFITNSCHYSSSTCKHQNYMNGAIPRKDKNVFVFGIDRYQRGASDLLWLGYSGTSDADKMRSLLRFGFDWLAEDYADCVGVKGCKKTRQRLQSFWVSAICEMVGGYGMFNCKQAVKVEQQ